jgi:hypothetical protein
MFSPPATSVKKVKFKEVDDDNSFLEKKEYSNAQFLIQKNK